jgi:hypothetical protein
LAILLLLLLLPPPPLLLLLLLLLLPYWVSHRAVRMGWAGGGVFSLKEVMASRHHWNLHGTKFNI